MLVSSYSILVRVQKPGSSMNQTSPGSTPVLPFTSCEAVTLQKRNDDIGYITEARLCMAQHGMVLLASRKEE